MTQDNEPVEPGGVEAGEPIARLADLEQEVSPQFLGAIRKKIYRRTAATQMVAFSWTMPKVILLEMVKLIAHFMTGTSEEKAKP